ncbi:MAG: RNA polymerase sigma factor [Planctomycetota bacterium]
MSAEAEIRARVDALYREHQAALLGQLLRRVRGDFELAEEALAEAWSTALEHWPAEGVPERPEAWLQTVAQRRLVDGLRRMGRARDLVATLGSDLDDRAPETMSVDPDDALRLLFACCHPSLAEEAQVALTLNAVCGLTSAEIARAFLLRETTLAQRLVRAKRKIRDAGIPLRIPEDELLAERLPVALAVIYLVFNEGYASTSSEQLVRGELTREALYLAERLAGRLPNEPEVLGLQALMLLQDSRRLARVSLEGELVLLEDQDRALWDRESIAAGVALLERALAMGRTGPYQVQAAIAAVHAETVDGSATDWAQIVGLYDVLWQRVPTPVVALNRAAAVAMHEGAERGLAKVEELAAAGALDGYLYYHALRARLHTSLGHVAEARESFAAALALAQQPAERRFLSARLLELDSAN